ncbi:hypothetical protein DIZ27_43730 [Streptomyces sp. NWU339]|uniref:TetR family transcriptional regulator n=1 Tax=Streptomyces sp. NWU339 TaxID=2185284 RepID=UPI000D6836AA|nr:hypothetical protein DIZ27_43730 [Streptomyces sp. NWU339]
MLSAAFRVFGGYGYRRSSMDLMAQAARMSRPAVYQSIDAARRAAASLGCSDRHPVGPRRALSRGLTGLG